MDSDIRPRIGIVRSPHSGAPGKIELYERAVLRAGGHPEFVCADPEVRFSAAEIDGFLFPGGKDIPPRYYNQEAQFPINPEEETRVRYDLGIMEGVMKYNKPVLGICYGMQLMNVFFGGTLYQDIAGQVQGAGDHRSGGHSINLIPNPYIPSGRCQVNSSHHQAVCIPGDQVRAFATADDGIIEGIYLEGSEFVVGLQWHPERSDDPLSELLFEGFISACRRS